MTQKYRACKILAFLFSLGLLVGIASGQTSTVTATIQDPTLQAWSNGYINYSIYGNGPYIWNGAALPSQYYNQTTVSLDNSGHASFTVPTTSAISPVGSLWKFVVCPNSSMNCVTAYIPINGSTVDISSAVNSLIPIPSIPIQTIPKAYNDSQIITQISAGGLYYNTGSLGGLRYWNGTAFAPIGGGASAGVSQINGSTGSFNFTGGVTCSGSNPVTCNFNTGAVTSVANSDGSITITPTTGAVVGTLNMSHANTWLANQSYNDGSTNIALFGNTGNGIGTHFSWHTTGTTGEFSFSDLGAQMISSNGQAYFASDNTFLSGLILDLNGSSHSGASTNPGIYPASNSKLLWLGGSTGITVSKITGQISTAPIDLSNGTQGIKINCISCSTIGTDSTGKIVAGTASGTGNVSTSGTTTSGYYPLFNGTNTVTNGHLQDTGSQIQSSEAIAITGAVSISGSTGSTLSASAGNCNLWADSTANAWMENCNNSASYQFALNTPASTIAPATTAIAANTCSAAATLTMTGVTTGATFNFTPTADPTAITGWGSTGGLTIAAWPTANTLNYKVCNQTSASITPGAITFNVSFQNHGVL